MAKPNYQYEKRQKEMAKKAKPEEKRRQKRTEVPKDENPLAPAPDPAGAPPEGTQR